MRLSKYLRKQPRTQLAGSVCLCVCLCVCARARARAIHQLARQPWYVQQLLLRRCKYEAGTYILQQGRRGHRAVALDASRLHHAHVIRVSSVTWHALLRQRLHTTAATTTSTASSVTHQDSQSKLQDITPPSAVHTCCWTLSIAV